MKKKTLMITGASGFIGKNFIEKYKNEYNIIPISLRDKKIDEINFKDIDVILHLAALVHQMKGAPEEEYFKINTELTKNLAEKAKESGVKHFIFMSTIAVWGTHGYFSDRVITLKTLENPVTAYGKSKLQAEKILKTLEEDKFKISILRTPLIYGEGAPGNIKKLVKLVKVLPIIPFGNENKRTMVNLEGVIEFIKKTIDLEITGIFIPRDPKDVSTKFLIEKILSKKKKIYIKIPNIIIKVLYLIFPNTILSLYGNLILREK